MAKVTYAALVLFTASSAVHASFQYLKYIDETDVVVGAVKNSKGIHFPKLVDKGDKERVRIQHYPDYTIRTGPSAPLDFLTWDKTCTWTSPCKECQGDCEDDSECEGLLKCFHRSNGGTSPVPGCSGTNTPDGDFCYDPNRDEVLGLCLTAETTYSYLSFEQCIEPPPRKQMFCFEVVPGEKDVYRIRSDWGQYYVDDLGDFLHLEGNHQGSSQWFKTSKSTFQS